MMYTIYENDVSVWDVEASSPENAVAKYCLLFNAAPNAHVIAVLITR